MSLNKKTVQDEEGLRFENELLKAKISAEYGGVHGSVKVESPEIENKFLNYIIEFEEAMKNSKEVLVYDFIGRPEFTKEEDLSDEQVELELAKMNDILYGNNIAYDNLNPVEDRLLYKFVTEELFQLKIADKSVSGMLRHFIYEDFHPDHEEETGCRCEEFMDMFFAGDFHEQIEFYFPKLIKNLIELRQFRDAFEEFRNLKYEILPSPVVPEVCTRKAKISFDAFTGAGTKPIHIEGEAEFELDYEHKWWTVISARFPGMEKGE